MAFRHPELVEGSVPLHLVNEFGDREKSYSEHKSQQMQKAESPRDSQADRYKLSLLVAAVKKGESTGKTQSDQNAQVNGPR